MLRGTFDVMFDKAGRTTVPARFRAELTDQIVAMPAIPDRECVMLLPAATADSFLEDMSREYGYRGADVVRQVSADAFDLELDKSGRILVPSSLRELAHLTGKAKVVGLVHYCELWDADTFEAWRTRSRSPEVTCRTAALLDRLAAPGAPKGGPGG